MAAVLRVFPGFAPVPIRGVLGVDPTAKHQPEAFFNTYRPLAPEKRVEYDVLHGNLEVAFEASRRPLGVGRLSDQGRTERWLARHRPGGLYTPGFV
jgi:hypothetical protein